MPLAATDVPGVEDLDGVRFPIMDGASAVPILGTREALEEIEGPSPQGTRSFFVWYRIGDDARRLTLGRYPTHPVSGRSP